jgi:DUF1009 family protein
LIYQEKIVIIPTGNAAVLSWATSSFSLLFNFVAVFFADRWGCFLEVLINDLDDSKVDLRQAIDDSGDVVGIICGGGRYPLLVAEACVRKRIEFCLVFLKGLADEGLWEDFFRKNQLHLSGKNLSIIVNFGEIGKAMGFLHRCGVKKVIFAGNVKRPNFSELSLDIKATSWLMQLGKKILRGDDDLLRAIASLLQNEGFAVMSGADLLDDVFLPEGFFTQKHPSAPEYEDIQMGFAVAKTIGQLDIGQSVVVHNGLVLGVECVEGTDALLDRCATLRKSPSGGILIKASKPQQDERFDLPTVGLETIRRLVLKKFSGVAFEAQKCIVLDAKAAIEMANGGGVFICGVQY